MLAIQLRAAAGGLHSSGTPATGLSGAEALRRALALARQVLVGELPLAAQEAAVPGSSSNATDAAAAMEPHATAVQRVAAAAAQLCNECGEHAAAVEWVAAAAGAVEGQPALLVDELVQELLLAWMEVGCSRGG